MSNLIIVFFLAAMAVLSVYGAFLGAARAQAFFNALPMAVFWCLLAVFLAAGFGIYPALRKRYPLLMIHAGCLLVLAGGLYGSRAGHTLFSRFFGGPSFTKGMMQLRPGQLSNAVEVQTDGQAEKLPFSIRLEDAFLEYYDQAAIRFYWGPEAFVDLRPEAGDPIQLPDGRGTVQVVKAFRNLKMTLQDGKMTAYEDDGPGSNPAWELQVAEPNGTTKTLYVFERFPMHPMQARAYAGEYRAPQMVKDYKSVLRVLDEGEPVKGATIEVNKPLYYGGYHFYQNTFGFDEAGPVSGLLVTSARGVWAVFAGYGLIFVGLSVQCLSKLRRRPLPASGGSR